MNAAEFAELERFMTPAERAELDALLGLDLKEVVWRPLPGPQTMAYESEADVIGFGGAAGGGKTDLALGLALTQHHRAQVFRLEGPQLAGMVDRLAELVGSREAINGKPPVYRDGDVQVEFNSMPNPGDETKYQGRPKDLLVIDEAANFLEGPVRFVKGWVRTTRPGQRTRVLLTFNPPTSAEGRWVIAFFGPWLDKKHDLYPTAPGALRWVYVDPTTGKDVWVKDDDSRPFVLRGSERLYDFDPLEHRPEDVIQPESRTFIPSRITDNPFLVSTGYMQQLQALPEPLRSQMLLGDFQAGVQDDPWQVVPTAWIEAAQARWRAMHPPGEMMGTGVDVARGGKDQTVIANRHKNRDGGKWFAPLVVHPGTETPNGNRTAGLVLAEVRQGSPIMIDVIGVGASPYDVLAAIYPATHGINVSERARGTDRSGRLTFLNQRSELWWKMREDLDPTFGANIALPPDPELLKELAAPRWKLSGMTVQVESREEIIDRIGRSPDRATAVILANIDMPKISHLDMRDSRRIAIDHDPYADL